MLCLGKLKLNTQHVQQPWRQQKVSWHDTLFEELKLNTQQIQEPWRKQRPWHDALFGETEAQHTANPTTMTKTKGFITWCFVWGNSSSTCSKSKNHNENKRFYDMMHCLGKPKLNTQQIQQSWWKQKKSGYDAWFEETEAQHAANPTTMTTTKRFHDMIRCLEN